MTPWNRDAEASDFAQAVKDSLQESPEARERRVITRAIRAGEDLLLMLAEAKLKAAEALEELRRMAEECRRGQ